jgi:small subunit ribosomal protein S8
MIDPISDMLTRIRNATRAGHAEVLVPFSNLKMKIAGVLEKKGFVQSVAVAEEGTPKKKIRIVLKYLKSEKGDRVSYIQGLQRVSRQGQRIYAGKNGLPFARGKYGFAVISTSKGLMTNNEARKAGVGGEVICEVW